MSTPPPSSSFSQTIAPLLLGSILACPLYGVAVAQGISYYRNYPCDPKFVKYSIALLLFIDSAHTFSLATAAVVWYLRATPDPGYPPAMIISTFFSYVTTAFVQSAFTLRVWILNGKRWLVPSILGFFVLCQLVGGLGMATNMKASGKLDDVHDINSNIFGILELASAMIGIKKSDTLIDKLIVYVIGISTLSSVFALLNLVTWLAMPNKVIFVIFHSVISKLYVNSLLVTLNSRHQLRHKLNKSGVSTTKEGDETVLSTFAVAS